ncbi:hypothetical protein ZOD2009_10420 [Haladaptatus paucihalophilus DX253]|uniref:Uncharacterized protein n=1 Tax=Haladaptatus paucihalophilus DX253 TaxID=797209 RepID=E7QTF6_HALPU|nr:MULTISPECIES: hypothetical protein [Haladaptatus]EFW91885.1 hypothetical protein ZOD2009_10420 [Haladaptatus paucihalophilus DX253]GKZ14050.1 hypothetical protein HAL_19310 [Haladaptatus sp. T7]SHK82095.1 hypothetical protein SAMN05444342_2287 [Haladaptatus paucihalophilus DX253]
MNTKELLGIALLIVGSVLIFGVISMIGTFTGNALAGLATVALAAGALMFGTGEGGRPV